MLLPLLMLMRFGASMLMLSGAMMIWFPHARAELPQGGYRPTVPNRPPQAQQLLANRVALHFLVPHRCLLLMLCCLLPLRCLLLLCCLLLLRCLLLLGCLLRWRCFLLNGC